MSEMKMTDAELMQGGFFGARMSIAKLTRVKFDSIQKLLSQSSHPQSAMESPTGLPGACGSQ